MKPEIGQIVVDVVGEVMFSIANVHEYSDAHMGWLVSNNVGVRGWIAWSDALAGWWWLECDHG